MILGTSTADLTAEIRSSGPRGKGYGKGYGPKSVTYEPSTELQRPVTLHRFESGSPGARTPNLRIRSLPDHAAEDRISSDCNVFRPSQTLPEPPRRVKKGQRPEHERAM